jgi:hypothetical protein
MMELIDCVYIGIDCDRCGKKDEGYGISDYDFAYDVKKNGWYVTRTGKVVCPDCDTRKSSKSRKKRK